MSSLSYETQYQETLADLTSLQHEDVYLTSVRLPQGAKNRYAFMLQYWLSLYVRYVQIAERLILIFNATIQPQQLQDMRNVVEACLGRLLEIKANLITYCGDALPLDNVLLDMKLLPEGPHGEEYNTCNPNYTASLLIPHYFTEDRAEELRARRAYVLSLQAHYAETESNAPVSLAQRQLSCAEQNDPTKVNLATNNTVNNTHATSPHATENAHYNDTTTSGSNNNTNEGMKDYSGEGVATSTNTNTPRMSLEEAIRLLQVCERGRQARQRAQLQLANYCQRQYNMEHGGEYNSVTGKDRAACVVQRVVLAYLARKHAASREADEKAFLGMVSTDPLRSNTERDAAQLRLRERKAHQRMNLASLQQRTMTMEQQIKQVEGPKKMEEMMDEILMYMAYAQMENKDNTLIELPPQDEGGSLKLLGRLCPDRNGNVMKRGNAEESARRNRRSTTRARSRSTESNNNNNNSNVWTGQSDNDGGIRESMSASQTQRVPSPASSSSFSSPLSANRLKSSANNAMDSTNSNGINKTSNANNGIMNTNSAVNINARADSMINSADPNNSLADNALMSERRTSSTKSRAGASGRSNNNNGESEIVKLPESNLWNSMNEASDKFSNVWRDRFIASYVTSNDFTESTDEALLREQLMQGPRGVLAQLRTCVDQLINVEVRNLKERIEAEKNAKRKVKRAKKAKKVKKPKLKDPAKGVDVETLFNTLIYENKLQLPPEHVMLNSFMGPESVSEYVRREEPWQTQVTDLDEIKRKWQRIIKGWNEEVEAAMKMKDVELTKLFTELCALDSPPMELPTFGHIRRALTEHIVLPLGSQVIHDLAPSVKCTLLYGFHSTGKTLASFAACNEAGANFFNISPSNFIATKGIAKTIQVVFNVARLRAPSIVYVDDVEKIFPAHKSGKRGLKKKDPLLVRGKKMKKELVKAITSTIQPTDRVMVVLVSSEPWNVDVGALGTLTQRAIYFPLPDYSARLSLLHCFIAHEMSRMHELSNHPYTFYIHDDALEHIALLTNNWSSGQLQHMVKRTLPPRRLEQLLQHKLDASDFIPSIASINTPTEEELVQMKTFYSSLPLYLRRVNAAVDFANTEDKSKVGTANRRRATGLAGRKSTVTFINAAS